MSIASLKAASDLAKGLVEVRDETKRRETLIELQGAIVTAQVQAISANDLHAALVEQKRALEAEVARLKSWDAEKQNYELKEVVSGVFAYSLKPSVETAEPPHKLCPNCYAAGKKSLLQSELLTEGRRQTLRCHPCATVLYLTGGPR